MIKYNSTKNNKFTGADSVFGVGLLYVSGVKFNFLHYSLCGTGKKILLRGFSTRKEENYSNNEDIKIENNINVYDFNDLNLYNTNNILIGNNMFNNFILILDDCSFYSINNVKKDMNLYIYNENKSIYLRILINFQNLLKKNFNIIKTLIIKLVRKFVLRYSINELIIPFLIKTKEFIQPLFIELTPYLQIFSLKILPFIEVLIQIKIPLFVVYIFRIVYKFTKDIKPPIKFNLSLSVTPAIAFLNLNNKETARESFYKQKMKRNSYQFLSIPKENLIFIKDEDRDVRDLSLMVERFACLAAGDLSSSCKNTINNKLLSKIIYQDDFDQTTKLESFRLLTLEYLYQVIERYDIIYRKKNELDEQGEISFYDKKEYDKILRKLTKSITTTINKFDNTMVEYKEQQKSYQGALLGIIKNDGSYNILNKHQPDIVAESSSSTQKASTTIPIKTESPIINEAIGAFRDPFVQGSTSNILSSNISQARSLPQSSSTQLDSSSSNISDIVIKKEEED